MNDTFYQWKLRASLVRRRAVWERAGVVFVHVPKAGGTSLARALYGGNTGHYTVEQLAQWVPRTMGRLPSFAVVRDPYARAESAWRFALGGGGDGMAFQGQSGNRGATLADFSRFCTDWLTEPENQRSDFVFLPQVHFVLDRSRRVGVNHVGKLEKLAATVGWLTATLGREIEVPRLNVSAGADDEVAWSPDAVAAVEDVYRDDFDAFGYRRLSDR